MEIGLFGALAGGVLTLLSPCSVMLLPAFFSYAFASPSRLLGRTGIFYLGLITTLVPLGVLAGTLGALVTAHRTAFVTTATIVIIVLGALMLLNVPLPFLRGGQAMESTSSVSVYALGTVYGVASTCAGPLLGAVLTVAAIGGNALYGGIVLLFFAAGMALPLLVLALLWGRLPVVRSLVRPREIHIGRWHNTWTGVVSGAVTVALGILLLTTDGTSSLDGILGASTQVDLEGWVYRVSNGVPDIVVALVTAGVAGTAWLILRFRRRQNR